MRSEFKQSFPDDNIARHRFTGELRFPNLSGTPREFDFRMGATEAHREARRYSPRYSVVILPSISTMLRIEAATDVVAQERWSLPGTLFHRPLRYRGGVLDAWGLTASSGYVPYLRGASGMPELPSFFYPEQTVEIDVRMCAYEYNTDGYVRKGVWAMLIGIKYLGGFVRGSE